MRSIVGLWLVLTALALGSAHAQPVCNPNYPGSMQCQPQAVNPQLTDIVIGTQQTGPTVPNQTVKLSISQILGMSGSSQYLPFTGGRLTGKLTTAASSVANAGFSLPPGAAPSSPSNGDIWTTAEGLYVQINGSPFGPLGTGSGGGGSGGTVNTGPINALPYYAAAGTTLSPLSTIPNALLQTDGSGAPSFSIIGPPGLTFRNVVLQPVAYASTSNLPSVTAANEGQEAFVLNCLNGTEGDPNGSGCPYRVDNTGSWVPYPRIPTQGITFAGQVVKLGQSATVQGTGSALATWNGSSTSGNLVSQGADGTLIDSGIASTGGGGGGGTGNVTAGVANQLAYYPGNGNTVAGQTSLNSAVETTDGSGIPGFRTTLPGGLNIPGPTISSPNITGSGQYGSLTGSGKLTTAGSTASQAGFNLVPGIAPTTPVNGDFWSTSGGFFMRVNGGTFPVGTGNGTLTGVLTNGPLTGGGLSGTLNLNCPGCLTSTGGGTLAVTAPLQFDQPNSKLAIGNQTRTFTFNADQYTTIGNAAYIIYISFPYATGSITSIIANTGGTTSSSFNLGVQVAGGNIANCSGLTVSLTSTINATCGANNIVIGNNVQMIISGVNGQPSNTQIQINYIVSAS